MTISKKALKGNISTYRSSVRQRAQSHRVGQRKFGGNTKEYKVAQASSQLTRRNISSPQNTSQNANMLSISVLESVGVSIETVAPYNGSDLSLIRTQTDDEIINNENILNLEDFHQKSRLVSLDDKFKNPSDPIYTLDDTLPLNLQQRYKSLNTRKNTPFVLDITATLCTLNLAFPDTALKQFRPAPVVVGQDIEAKYKEDKISLGYNQTLPMENTAIVKLYNEVQAGNLNAGATSNGITAESEGSTRIRSSY